MRSTRQRKKDICPVAEPAWDGTEHRKLPPWKWRDLVVDRRTGILRETLLWSNVGKASATIAFLYNVYQDQDTEWLWLLYLGVLTMHEVTSRILSAKLGVPPPVPAPEPQQK